MSGIGLEVSSQMIMRRIIWNIRIKIIKGEIFILREGLRADNVGCFKNTGMTFVFVVNPITTDILVSVIGYNIEIFIP